MTDRLRQDFAYGTSLAPASNALSYAPDTPATLMPPTQRPFYKAPPVAAPTPRRSMRSGRRRWAAGVRSRVTATRRRPIIRSAACSPASTSPSTASGALVWLAATASRSSGRRSIAASGSSDNYHIALYGGGQVGAWGLRGGASFSWNDIIDVAAGRRGQSARARSVATTAAKTTQVFGEVGHNFAFGAGALEPFANIAYVHVDGGINETRRRGGHDRLDRSSPPPTPRWVCVAPRADGTLTARGTLGWRHALGDVTPVAALAFQSGGAAFAFAGSPIARDALVAEAGLDLVVAATPRSVFPGPASSPTKPTTIPSKVILAGDSEFTLSFGPLRKDRCHDTL